jgi:hypothetical protein
MIDNAGAALDATAGAIAAIGFLFEMGGAQLAPVLVIATRLAARPGMTRFIRGTPLGTGARTHRPVDPGPLVTHHPITVSLNPLYPVTPVVVEIVFSSSRLARAVLFRLRAQFFPTWKAVTPRFQTRGRNLDRRREGKKNEYFKIGKM